MLACGNQYVFAEPKGLYANGPANRWRVWLLDVEGETAVVVLLDYAGRRPRTVPPPRLRSIRYGSRRGRDHAPEWAGHGSPVPVFGPRAHTSRRTRSRWVGGARISWFSGHSTFAERVDSRQRFPIGGRAAPIVTMVCVVAKRNGTGIALLADETRRRIVALLAVQPRRPSAIAAELGLSRPATSRQLRLLEQAGLIWAFRSRLDGRGFVYSIRPSAQGRIIAWLAGTGRRAARSRHLGRGRSAWLGTTAISALCVPADAPSPSGADGHSV